LDLHCLAVVIYFGISAYGLISYFVYQDYWYLLILAFMPV